MPKATSGANPKYIMSFTAGALFKQASILAAGLYKELGDWSEVRDQILGKNLLQARTKNTSKRNCREILSRLRRLTSEQIALLNDGMPTEQEQILWAAVCKRYRFILDFAVEVIHGKFMHQELLLTPADYDGFYKSKTEWHEGLLRVSESTQKSYARTCSGCSGKQGYYPREIT
jgi:hypothetical protein